MVCRSFVSPKTGDQVVVGLWYSYLEELFYKVGPFRQNNFVLSFDFANYIPFLLKKEQFHYCYLSSNMNDSLRSFAQLVLHRKQL